MGRPRKLNTTTENTTKATVETTETVEEIVETVEEIVDDVEVTEDVDVVEEIETVENVEEIETVENVTVEPEDITSVCEEQHNEVDPTFVPVSEENANDEEFQYVEPQIIVETSPSAVKPVRLDHLRHGAPRKNVQKATKMCDGVSAGVTFSTKVAKMF